MPKDRRVNSPTFDRSTVSPYARGFNISDGNRTSLPSAGDEREWEETRCPICMEHPHNAVLLICSSQDKGCRPFMCNTSYRHSNCLDQFRNSSAAASSPTSFPCPLCRGTVTKWVVIEEARRFMNSKTRSCSLETCDFSGNYAELRKHARVEHPSCRPSVVSPTRQSNWNALEQEIDSEDALAHYFDDASDYEWGELPSSNEDEDGDADHDDYDYDYDDDDDDDESLLDFPLGMSDIEDEMEEMFSRRIYFDMFMFMIFGNQEMVDFGSSRSGNGIQRSSNMRNSSSTSNNERRNTSASRSLQPSNRIRRESRYRTISRFGRVNLEGIAGSNSRTRANHRSSSGIRANHHSSSRARANYHSSSGPRANYHSSSRARANHHPSSRARANHYSSSRTRATHDSGSRPRADHYSSSRTRANDHSSSRTRANDHSSSRRRANHH